jgi:hypothetical protein
MCNVDIADFRPKTLINGVNARLCSIFNRHPCQTVYREGGLNGRNSPPAIFLNAEPPLTTMPVRYLGRVYVSDFVLDQTAGIG